eukprot:1822817-Lingulodinium_polyedra.AAC.1
MSTTQCCEAVTVSRTQHRIAFVGGHVHSKGSGTAVYTATEVAKAVAGLCRLSHVAVGDGICSLQGLPIGGVASKASCSAVLGLSESRWVERGFAQWMRGAGLQWQQMVLMLRYVDDVLMVSAFLCCACLQAALAAMMPI